MQAGQSGHRGHSQKTLAEMVEADPSPRRRFDLLFDAPPSEANAIFQYRRAAAALM